MFTMSRAELVTMLNSYNVDTGSFSDVKVGLFKNDITPDLNTVIGDLTPADYTGYAAQATVPLGATYDNDAGDAILAFTPKIFQPTGSAATSTIYGWYLYHDASPDVLISAAKLDTPVVLASALDALVVDPRVMIGGPKSPDLLA